MASAQFPQSRSDIAYILTQNEYGILATVNEVIDSLNIEDEMRQSVTSYVKIVLASMKKSKKSLENLNNEWWTAKIPWESRAERACSISKSSITSELNVRKPLLKLSLQQQRTRLSSILEQLREIVSVEESTPFVIAALALQLLANEEDNRQVSKVAKEIVVSGGFSNINERLVPVEKALFLLDLLEVGRRKYTQLRQTLLPDNIVFPSYAKLADLRDIVISRPSICLYPDPVKPIGVHLPYFLQVKRTLERILSTIDKRSSEEFPLTFKIADGLDGSGCHTFYNQHQTNTSTKNFILFCFKPISIQTTSGRVVWQNNSPNSPFSQRPIFLCAAKESERNIRTFMEDLINPDTSKLSDGISTEYGPIIVEINRSMFDGKMAAILSGTGGASCQMCTATRKDLKDRNLVVDGFPINRLIMDAAQLFSEIDDVHFAMSD